MKSFNYFAMSLAATAMISFASCSSNDDLAGNNNGEAKVDGFYMTLSVQTPTDNGSRTVQKNKFDATAEESALSSGTFYLVDAAGNIKFQQDFTADELSKKSATFKIAVENVAAGATYKAYFLANATDATPWKNVFTATNKFAKPYDTANNFAMFNQNDGDVDGNGYTVKFTDDNKKETSPAKILYKGNESAIKIERLAARIDEPTSLTTEISAYKKDDATPAEKKAMADAVKKVASVTLNRYAIANAANKSFIMQTWEGTTLNIPSGITYYQPTKDFGTKTKLENDNFFAAADKTDDDDAQKDYVFENNASTAVDATAIYFEYKVTLNDMEGADFSDGTFYRYNNVIYKSFADIFAAYEGVGGLFNGASAEKLKEDLTDAKTKGDVEKNLSDFREKYDIEVFNEGKTYYKQIIQDQYIGYANAIQRNSVYQLTVKNIFNVGAQVPNGEPDKDGLFYLDVTVSVNPWVLNTQDVYLK